MMKKLFLAIVIVIAAQLLTSNTASAQKGTDYSNAFGMRLEFGSDYGTLAGISGKHFFDTHNAAEAQVLFGSRLIMLDFEYQYHGEMPNAPGLKWYAGFGPTIAFSRGYSYGGYYGYYYTSGSTDILLRPVVGLDYKIDNVPLNFSFDWRPAFQVTHGTAFNAARFGLAVRFALP